MPPTIATYLGGGSRRVLARGDRVAELVPPGRDEAQLGRQIARLGRAGGRGAVRGPTDPSALELVERQEGNTTSDYH